MTMNYEQIRAGNAISAANDKGKYKFLGVKGGRAVAKKVPSQIIQNGFLASLAFAIEKGEGYKDVFHAIVEHLSHPDVKCTFGVRTGSLDEFLKDLSGLRAEQLRAITEESLGYLNCLRRFAKPE